MRSEFHCVVARRLVKRQAVRSESQLAKYLFVGIAEALLTRYLYKTSTK